MVFPASEKIISLGVLVAGTAKNLLQTLAKQGKLSCLRAHHSKGFFIM